MTPVAMQILASWIDLDHFAIYGVLVACMVLALAAGHWLGRRHQASGNVAGQGMGWYRRWTNLGHLRSPAGFLLLWRNAALR
jgi:hypothetical protein